MRKPNINDLFLAAKIARKLELKKLEIDFKAPAEEVGGKVLAHVIENIDKAQDEIGEFLGGLLELPKEEVFKKPLDEVYQELKEMGGLSDFFTSLGRSKILKSTISS